LNWRTEENLVVNNKDNRVFISWNCQSDGCPWKFDVLKTGIFALEALLLGQIFVLRSSNFCGATISRQFLDRNTLLFKNIVGSVVNQGVTFEVTLKLNRNTELA